MTWRKRSWRDAFSLKLQQKYFFGQSKHHLSVSQLPPPLAHAAADNSQKKVFLSIFFCICFFVFLYFLRQIKHHLSVIQLPLPLSHAPADNSQRKVFLSIIFCICIFLYFLGQSKHHLSVIQLPPSPAAATIHRGKYLLLKFWMITCLWGKTWRSRWSPCKMIEEYFPSKYSTSAFFIQFI